MWGGGGDSLHNRSEAYSGKNLGSNSGFQPFNPKRQVQMGKIFCRSESRNKNTILDRNLIYQG